MMRYLASGLLFVVLAWTGNTWAADAAVRIGFLFNFSRYIEWSDAALTPDEPLTFCLAPGDAEMASEFATLERQKLRNRAVKAIQVLRPADIVRCHVLYLPADPHNGFAPWLASAERTSALTVSDRPDFPDEGGMIGLVMIAGRYRFDVNLVSAKRRGLSLSAELLKLARSVK